MQPETIFTYGAPALKFGAGAADEIGYDVAQLGARRVLVVTDAGVAATGTPDRVVATLAAAGIEATLFTGVHVEPTDTSVRDAADVARASGPWDAFVAVGGGSSIDTAKAMNLLTRCSGDLLDYVNVPVGRGRAPEVPLAPLVAVPTTTGTGSESTSICVLDVLELAVKTGISHPRLRPALAVVDPDLTVTQPPGVTASAGLDILCHALESYTARPYTAGGRKRPEQRVPYCGANPLSDLFAERALGLLGASLRAAVRDGDARATRSDLALAATFAGLGFGNAGVHVPHANGYPIAGRVRDYRAPGYPPGEPLVPHGMSVALTAPEAFRFTFDAAPARHLRAAALLDPAVAARLPGAAADPLPSSGAGAPAASAAWRDALPDVLVALLRELGLPNGLAEVGYGAADVADLVTGALQQQRLLATAPKPVTADDLAAIFHRSLQLW